MHDINDFKPKVQREKIWLFNSAGTFSGNVKYLFLYIVNYRPDIYACYISGDQSNVDYIRSLGYRACHFKSEQGKNLMRMAGVYVNEQVKEHYPVELYQAKLLNLYHGVGLKQIERKWDRAFLGLKMASKYIRYNEYFYKNMCFLVSSPFMETHFKEQLDLEDNQIIRGDYPRCSYQNNYNPISTFDHNIHKNLNLPNDTKIALYAPTYREYNADDFIYKAVPDWDILHNTLKKNHILLIVKLHQKSINSFQFNTLNKIISNYRHITIWDNQYDIYEIINKIDIGIIDYSSIYYDLLAAGVPYFIRYIFDFEEESKFLIYDYFDNTNGIVCKTFNEFINSFDTVFHQRDDGDRERIKELFWSYSSSNTCESIVEQALAFEPNYSLTLPTLYSFDIFDTLIARKVLQPRGIFYRVQDKICQTNDDFPEKFKTEYVAVRMQAEANIRERLYKTVGHFEISFDDIFIRLAEIYHLTSDQIKLLKQWEIESELENVIPVEDKVTFAENLIRNGEQVVLISDMYLPKEVILAMLRKVSPLLAKAPLFLSSERKVQKTTQLLYLEVYRHFTPYRFKEWHHYGDNKIADGDKAKKLGIIPHIHEIPKFSPYEQAFVNRCKDYDSYLFAGMLARFRTENNLTDKEYFAFAYVSCYLVPYIAWVIRDAQSRGFKTLYFISRDGYFLKKTADAFIDYHKITIKTKYIYGSRKAWRLPSQVDYIDDEFFSEFGNFTAVSSYQILLEAISATGEEFHSLFPELEFSDRSEITTKELTKLRNYFKHSTKFHKFILEKARQKREIIIQYLQKEIDFSEKFAFVEYWGRGYTQTCLSKLLTATNINAAKCHCYYYRSILTTTDNNIRYNYSTNNTSLIFIEAIFANHPTTTVYGYSWDGEYVKPNTNTQEFDSELFKNIEQFVKNFVNLFYAQPFIKNIETLEKIYSDISLYWYRDHQDDPVFINSISHLQDNTSIYGQRKEFAPEFTSITLAMVKEGVPLSTLTRSIKMSLARSSPAIRSEYKSIKNKASSGKKLRKLRLLAKLERDPHAFFADSNIYLFRALSKTTFLHNKNNIMRQFLIYIVKNIIKAYN